MLDTLFIGDFIDRMEEFVFIFRIIIGNEIQYSTDKISETVSMIRNKKIIFYRQK